MLPQITPTLVKSTLHMPRSRITRSGCILGRHLITNCTDGGPKMVRVEKILVIRRNGFHCKPQFLSLPLESKGKASHQLQINREGLLESFQLFSTSSTSPSLTKDEERTINCLAAGILSNNNGNGNGEMIDISSRNMNRRIALSKSITLVESRSSRKRLMADVLLERLKKSSSEKNGTTSFRLGIAGPPGAGKSTFVETLGMYILGLKEDRCQESFFQPEKLAVLCIDPSSNVTGGSILGDKTRMSNLSYHQRAYVRPSPSSGTLGGIGSYTYDAASLCEIAGYDLTIIETVGVGQSEVELAECCDLFLLMLAPGGGDELQGSKKGIVEVTDVLVVNKTDGETEKIARQTASEYKKAMGLLRKPAGWWGRSNEQKDCEVDSANKAPTTPPVLLISAKTGYGIPELWKTIIQYQQYAKSSGHLSGKRRLQNRYWMWKYLRERVLETVQGDPRVKCRADEIENSLDSGVLAPRVAARKLWKNITGEVNDET
mmetsp:Transcript_24317/g.58705  ORF Transcript_24317/g.58705 Transcript_24317/m.58705 type:complete len:489 (+) Transcript_24317:13-1479(+)